ncbi:hypothetical protein HK104_005033 [Borealophlyctis nickersoniae]|nr:hypothetical protein HK104_005033 [Borealophlyctis nickersoniae]
MSSNVSLARKGDGNSQASIVFQTKAVFGITTDPFHPHRFASWADDSIIRIWDVRNPTEPALSLNAEYRNGIAQLEWSPLRAGLLASVGKDSPTVKLWDIQEGTTKQYVSSTVQRRLARESTRSATPGQSVGPVNLGTSPGDSIPVISVVDGGSGGANPGIAVGAATGSGGSIAQPSTPLPSPGLLGGSGRQESPTSIELPKIADEPVEAWSTIPILWKAKQVTPRTSMVHGFAWLPTARPGDFTHRIITHHLKEPEFIISDLPVTYKMTFSPMGGMVITGGKSVSVISVDTAITALDRSVLLDDGGDFEQRGELGSSVSTAGSRKPSGIAFPHFRRLMSGIASPVEGSFSEIRDGLEGNGRALRPDCRYTLGTDISVVMRERASAGYSMDPDRNQTVLSDADEDLKELWKWVKQIQHISSHGRMRIFNKDFSTRGVHSVVQEMMHSGMSHVSPFGPIPRTGSTTTDGNSSEQPTVLPFVSYTNPFRRLALLICGWDFDQSAGERNLERILSSMEADGQYEKAAGWALFHSSSLSRAIQALKSSKEERMKLVAAALAGYFNSTPTSGPNLWQEMCHSLSSELRDPYLRAMFALIASKGDWNAVLQEKGLSIRDRIGVALRFLDDEALSKYITSMTEKMVSEGNVEGLVLTGLTPMGVDLFEKYVDRTGDIQTASLTLSMVSPRRFKDIRVDDWVEKYVSRARRFMCHAVASY